MAEEDEEAKLRKALLKRIREAQIEQQKREILRKYLDAAAYERIMNVRVSNFELYSQLADLLISMVQSGRISGKLTDEQLKSLLAKLTYRPEPKIEFKHK